MQATNITKSASIPLSAKSIEAMKPGMPVKADTGEYAGLRVKCGATSLKTFFYRYRSPETDKLIQIKIGCYPAMSLAQARVALEEHKQLRRTGICPKAESLRILEEEKAQKRQVEQEAQQQRFTVTDMVELYLTEFIEDRYVVGKKDPTKKRKVLGARKPKGQIETRRTLYCDVVEAMGDRPAYEVIRKEVVKLIMEIVGRGANVQAGRVLSELTSAFEYAIGREYFNDDFVNPALLAKASLKQARVKLTCNKGKRVLSDRELSELFAWLPGSGFTTTQKKVIRFTLWTGCRTGEVCAAQWKDIDLEKGTWHIRDSKNGAERYVQLCDQAVRFLKEQEPLADTYVFCSSSSIRPILQKSLTITKYQMKNPNKMSNRRKFKKAELWIDTIDDWTPHDLRRTVRTGLSRLRCPSEVAEAILGHSRKGIEGTYDLHGYEKECKEWLQKWADHLDRL